MRAATMGLLALLLTGAPAAWSEVLVRAEPALLKVLQDDPWPDEAAPPAITLNTCRGEVEWGQIVLRSSRPARVQAQIGGWRVDATQCGGRLPSVTMHIAHYVLVDSPSGNRVRRVARWPDPLPEANVCSLQPDQNQALYVAVDTPAGCVPGVYCAEIALSGDDMPPVSVPLKLIVWDVELPAVPTMRSSYYVWWDGIKQRYHTGESLEPLDRFFWFLVDHRLCPMSLPVDITDPRADAYMADPRVNGVRVPYLPPEQLAPVLKHVSERGWLDRTYVYLLDEPALRDWGKVHEASNVITGLEPRMARLDSIQPEPQLEGYVSIWCPNVEAAYLYRDRITNRSAAGDEVWWYTCVTPKYPFPGYLLDDDAVAPRLLLWMQALYGMTGSMYINTIHWGPDGWDPWERGVISMPQQSNNHDGLLMYSGREPDGCYPVSSVRLEMIRDGIEDWELLQLVRGTALAAAARVGASPQLADDWVQGLCSQVMPEVPQARRSPSHLMAVRRRVLRSILRLRQEPQAVASPPSVRRPVPLGEMDEGKFIDSPRGSAPPSVDGDLSDVCWRRSAAANAPGMRTVVTRLRNLTGRIWPSQNTVLCTAWTADGLHISMYCQEPEPAKLVLRAADGAADHVWLQLEGGRHLTVTAGGDVALDGPWPEGAVQAAVGLDEEGYAVEINLDLSTLGMAARPGQRVPLNFGRYAAPGKETLAWVSRQGDRDSPSAMGVVTLR